MVLISDFLDYISSGQLFWFFTHVGSWVRQGGFDWGTEPAFPGVGNYPNDRSLKLVVEAAVCYMAAYDPPECTNMESLLLEPHFAINQASQHDGLFKDVASREICVKLPPIFP